MPSLSGEFHFQQFTDAGAPLASGRVYTYTAGTTTKKTAYTDAAGSVAHTYVSDGAGGEYIALNSRGELPSPLFLASGSYDITLKTSAGVTVWTRRAIGDNSEFVLVTNFGADDTGVSSAVSAFQAAIDSTTNAGIQVIHVPRGTYSGDMTTLTYGSRTVVWQEEGGVTYSTAAPTSPRINSKYSGDSTRPWYVGSFGYAKGVTAGDSTDRPVLRINRDCTHTGGTTGGSIESSALNIAHTIGANVQNYETALIAAVDCSAGGTGTPNIVAAHLETRKNATGATQIFGVNIVAKDTTLRKSSVSTGALIGNETDVVCAGPDDSNLRIGQEIISREYDTSADGATSIYCGLRIRTAAGTATTIKNGIIIAPVGAGSITTGIDVQGTTTGIAVQGTPSNAHIEIQCDNTAQGILKVGSQRASAVVTAQINLTGYNDSSAKKNYATINCTIGSATAGAENGSLLLQTLRAGTNTTEVSIAGGVQVGAPTGGAKGVGSINVAADIYKNNTAFTNPHGGFEYAYTGKVERYADRMAAIGLADYRAMSIEDLEAYTRENFHFPYLGDDEGNGYFQGSERLLLITEEIAVHLFNMNRRLKALEAAHA